MKQPRCSMRHGGSIWTISGCESGLLPLDVRRVRIDGSNLARWNREKERTSMSHGSRGQAQHCFVKDAKIEVEKLPDRKVAFRVGGRVIIYEDWKTVLKSVRNSESTSAKDDGRRVGHAQLIISRVIM